MRRVTPLPGRQVLLTAALILLAMLAVGSFADYPISLALYHGGNLPSRILAGFGEYPVALGLASAGAMLVSARSRERRLAGALQTVGGCLCILLGGAMAAALPTGYLDIPTWASAIIGIGCTVAVVWGILHLCQNADRWIVLRVAAVFLLVIFADILVVNLIKIPWGRARMRLVAVDNQAYFMPWWQPGTGLRDALTAAGVPGEEFKSFPSGHSANSSALMLLALLPMLCPSLARCQTALFCAGFGWALVVAVSRIAMGAHYLSDTAVGLAVGLAALTVTCRLLFPAGKAAGTPSV
ncbi:MAG: phosphatase PAP2 family protein [Ruminococcus flavefaciens]|nr:phosphatase PAP2 family protein [Ruminococcus flavefaciens]